jgi:hypothetical protein
MRYPALASVLLFCALAPAVFAAQKSDVVSTGGRFDMKKVLVEEGTTVLLFVQATSVMEQQFVGEVGKLPPPNAKVAIKVVNLKDVSAPAAQQMEIKATPTAVVLDRFGKEIGRSSQPEEIKAAIRKGTLMARIKWVDEDDPKAPEIYGAPAAAIKRGIPGIVKSMALRPEVFQMFNLMSNVHFSKGFLERREHEMIAAYVSALNKCKF